MQGQYRDGRMYPATIAAVAADGSSFTLDWADGKKDDRVKKAANLRAEGPQAPTAPSQGSAPASQLPAAAAAPAATPPAPRAQFKVGDRVEGQFRDGRWNRATVAAVAADASTYTLDWADGKQEDRVKKPSCVRQDPAAAAAPAPAPAPLFKAGDIVSAQPGAGGEWLPATVAEARADGTYLLAWGSGAAEGRDKPEAALRAYTGLFRSCLVSKRPIAVGDRFVLSKHGPVLEENLAKYDDMKKALLTGFE